MKLLLALACSFFALSSLAYSTAAPQTFPTSAGEVKITPLYHASTLIEAGGRVIYLDPAKPAKLAGQPKADLILITDIHGDHMDPASIAEISKAGTDILAAPAAVATELLNPAGVLSLVFPNVTAIVCAGAVTI